jgi:hypothetical protein
MLDLESGIGGISEVGTHENAFSAREDVNAIPGSDELSAFFKNSFNDSLSELVGTALIIHIDLRPLA